MPQQATHPQEAHALLAALKAELARRDALIMAVRLIAEQNPRLDGVDTAVATCDRVEAEFEAEIAEDPKSAAIFSAARDLEPSPLAIAAATPERPHRAPRSQRRSTPRARSSRARRARAGAGSPSRARSPGRSDDDPEPPPPWPCECGCGELAPAGRRTVNEVHATRIRVRRCRDLKRVDEPDAAAQAAERELARYERRRDEQAREAAAHDKARARVEALAERRLDIWLRLPSANGDGAALRGELDQVTRQLADEWEAVRMVEAVAR